MKITVLVCTRNRPEIIESCIKSILNNTYCDFEFLIVDQSTDKRTEEIVKKYMNADKRIKYLHMDGQGKTKALNLGVRNSSGDIIAQTDDDCIVAEDWLENIIETFQKNPDVAVVFGSVVDNKAPGGRKGRDLIKDGKFAGRLSKLLFIGDAANRSVRRVVYEKIKGHDELLGIGTPLLGSEDQDFVYRVLKAGFKVLCVRKIIVTHYVYRVRDLNSYISVIRGFQIGEAAYLFKHFRCCLDCVAVVILFIRLIRRIFRMSRTIILLGNKLPIKQSQLLLLLQLGFLYVCWTLSGIIKSMEYPIDKTNCLFIPRE